MRQIKNITKHIVGFDGKPINDMANGQPVVVKNILLQYLAGYMGQSTEDIFLAMKIGQRLYDWTEDIMDLEDTEYNLLKKTVAIPKHIALVMSKIYEAIGNE